MVSKAEQAACHSLRSVLATVGVGDAIEASDELAELDFALEVFLPELLRESHPSAWRGESFDGFRWAVARKTGPAEAAFFGLALLVSDQTWTPIHVRIRSEPRIDAISWVSCKVGDGGAAGKNMTRLPYESGRINSLLFSLGKDPDCVDWAFTIVRAAPGHAV